MSRTYKNVIKLRKTAYGPERRANLAKEVVKDSTPLPLPVEYKDIDEEFKRWVDEDLGISFDGQKLPTVSLFSNQRFTEYMQTWQNVDNKKNMLLNFKTISRENNPKAGTIVGSTMNIPGERTALMRRVESRDRDGRKYYTDYRMKQPFAIDLIYTVSVVTNKYELLNEFNQMMNDKFKSINCYIRPNGHFMPMKLNDISDKSEYSIDNRQFYSQSYNITVKAYIITPDSLIVEERPDMKFLGMEGDAIKHSYAEVEELPCEYKKESDYAYVPIVITVHFEACDSKYTFTMDCEFALSDYSVENIRSFKFYINDQLVELEEGLRLRKDDVIKIAKVDKIKYFESGDIVLNGFDPTSTYKKSEGVDEKTISYS